MNEDESEFKVTHNMNAKDDQEKAKSLTNFNQWAERFVSVDGATKAYSSEETEDAVKAVGNQIAMRAKIPVFGHVKGSKFDEAERGQMKEYRLDQVQKRDFVWAAWTDAKEMGMDDLEQYKINVATTLNMVEKLINRGAAESEVLQISVPAHAMPQEGDERIAFRDAFLTVVSEWAQSQQVLVILHGLKERDTDAYEKDEVEMFKSGSLSDKTYILTAPREANGTDMIYTAEKFMEESIAHKLDTNNLAAAAMAPTIVTMIPGDNWEHVGGKAYEQAKTEEEKIAMVAPMSLYVFSPVNKIFRARMAQALHY